MLKFEYIFKFWWLFSLFALGYGSYQYFEISAAEKVGGQINLTVIELGIYKLLGKWGLVGMFGFGGLVAFPLLGYCYHRFLKTYFKPQE